MLKLKIKMDKSKYEELNEYDIAKVLETLDLIFVTDRKLRVLQKTEDGRVYRDNGTNRDLGKFFNAIWQLAEEAWFMDYVLKFMWYDSDDGMDEDDFETEDILKYLESKGRFPKKKAV